MRAPSCVTALALAVALPALGCRPDAAGPPASYAPEVASVAAGVGDFGEWSAPARLDAPINSAFIDNGPHLSRDGLTLYFASARPVPGAQRIVDIWVSRRPCADWGNPDCEWGTPKNLGPPVNTEAVEAGPELSRDGHWLYFTSNREGTTSAADIWASWRADPNDDAGWTTPVRVGGGVNTSEHEAGPSIWGPELYFHRGPRAGANGTPADIFVRAANGEVSLVEELSVDGYHDQRPSVRFDGREIFFASNRPSELGATEDIYVSTRAGNGRRWELPVNLGAVVNSAARDNQASISEDGTTLLFASDRAPSANFDIWVTTRSRRGADRP